MVDFKKALDTQHRQNLHLLLTICNVIKPLNSNAAKGKLLVEFLNENPDLEPFFRAAYDGDAPVPLAIRRCFEKPTIYGKEARIAASRVNKGDLKCGLTEFVVAKVFEKCGFKPLKNKKAAPLKAHTEGLMFDLASAGGGVINGSICFNGIKIGTIQFGYPNPKLQPAMMECRRLGIVIYQPAYIEKDMR